MRVDFGKQQPLSSGKQELKSARVEVVLLFWKTRVEEHNR